MTLHKSHPVFDIESEIIKANYPCPVSLKSFQDRIDRIVGKAPDGKSRVRVVWGQAATMVVDGKTRMKFPFWRVEDESGEIRDIGTPRFFIEELHTNEELQAGDRWEQARYYYDPDTKKTVDVLGPIPEDGFYTAIFLIAHHDHLCCNGAEQIKYAPCLGAYREPTDADLQRIRRFHYQREQASNRQFNPTSADIAKKTIEMREKRDEDARQGIREIMADFVKTHSHAWDTLDPTVAKWGAYHFTAAHNKSGLKKEKADGSSSDTAA